MDNHNQLTIIVGYAWLQRNQRFIRNSNPILTDPSYWLPISIDVTAVVTNT
jgi:hypothetical protein